MSSALNKASSASASAESKAPVLVADQEITNVKTKIDTIEAKIEALEAQLKKAEKKRDDWEEKDINSLQYKDAKEEVLSLRARIHDEEAQLLALRRKEELLLQPPTSLGKSLSYAGVLCAVVLRLFMVVLNYPLVAFFKQKHPSAVTLINTLQVMLVDDSCWKQLRINSNLGFLIWKSMRIKGPT